MDTSSGVSRFSAVLLQRGTHRLQGNPSLGTFSAFLTLLFFIRIAANLYLAVDLSSRGSSLDAVQIAGAHFVYLAAYGIVIGSLSAFRVGFALPQVCFINFSPLGRSFRNGFIRRAAFLRPLNMVFLAVFIAAAVMFSMVNESWQPIVFRASIVFISVVFGIVIVVTAASRLIPGRSEIQLMETLSLLVLVGLNPDIAGKSGLVGVSFRGFSLDFHPILELEFLVAVIIVLALIILLIIKVLSAAGSLFQKQAPMRPMESWYRRFIRIKWWVLLYAAVTPVFASPFFSSAAKRWALIAAILFSIFSYAYFIAQCENTLREKWRISLYDKGNVKLLMSSFLLHIILTLVPLARYVAARKWG